MLDATQKKVDESVGRAHPHRPRLDFKRPTTDGNWTISTEFCVRFLMGSQVSQPVIVEQVRPGLYCCRWRMADSVRDFRCYANTFKLRGRRPSSYSITATWIDKKYTIATPMSASKPAYSLAYFKMLFIFCTLFSAPIADWVLFLIFHYYHNTIIS